MKINAEKKIGVVMSETTNDGRRKRTASKLGVEEPTKKVSSSCFINFLLEVLLDYFVPV